MPPFGIFDPEKMTQAQKDFWVGMTAQRVANMWSAADFIADLPNEAKDLLQNADPATLKWLERARPEEIQQLQRSIKIMEASKLLAKFLWFVVIAGVLQLLGIWEKLSALFKVKT